MPWLRVEVDYADHPKTLRLKELLGNDLADAFLVRLWAWTLRYAPGGDLTEFTNNTIGKAVGFQGDANEFVRAMLEAGLLEPAGGESGAPRSGLTRNPGERLSVHDWEDHSGKYESLTASGKARMARYRERRRNANIRVTPSSGDAGVTVPGSPCDAPEVEDEIEVKKIKTTSSPPPRKPRGNGQDDLAFNKFWSAYPRKVGKTAARKAWAKVHEQAPAVMSALEWQVKSAEHLDRDLQYVPHASTWLNARRWEDERPRPRARPGAREDQFDAEGNLIPWPTEVSG